MFPWANRNLLLVLTVLLGICFLCAPATALYVAASDASAGEKAIADYTCDGVHDEQEINFALWNDTNGNATLSSGHFYCQGTASSNATDIKPRANGRLIGNGTGNTYINYTTSKAYDWMNWFWGGIVLNNSYITVRDFNITGSGFILIMGNHSIIENVTISATGGYNRTYRDYTGYDVSQGSFYIWARNWTIQNLTFRNDHAIRSVNWAGFMFNGGWLSAGTYGGERTIQNVTMENCTYYHAHGWSVPNSSGGDYDHGFILAEQSTLKNSVIRNCTAEGAGQNGFSMEWDPHENNTLIDCVSKNNGEWPDAEWGAGYYFEGGIRFINCHSENNLHGFYASSWSGTYASHYVNLTGCSDRGSVTSFRFRGMDDSTLINCEANSSELAVDANQNDNMTLVNFTMTNVSGGDGTPNPPTNNPSNVQACGRFMNSERGRSYDFNVDSCDVSKGIFLEKNTGDLVITGEIEANSQYPVYINGSDADVTLRDLTIRTHPTTSPSAGVYFNSSVLYITNYLWNMQIIDDDPTPTLDYGVLSKASHDPHVDFVCVSGADTDYDGVVVNHTCAGADFTANITSGCSPLPVQFNDSSDCNSCLTWNWSFGDGQWFNTSTASAKNASHTFSTTGSFDVSLRLANASTYDTETKSSYITAGSSSVASFTKNSSGGYDLIPVQFNDTSTGGPTSWIWQFNNVIGNATWITIGTVQNATQTFAIGNFSIRLSSTGGCGASNTSTQVTFVNVTPTPLLPPPSAAFTSNVTTGCSPLPVQFNDTSDCYGCTMWNWSFGAGEGWYNTSTAADRNASHAWYISSGYYTVSLYVKNTSSSDVETKTNYIYISSVPTATFSQSASTGDGPTYITFTDTSLYTPTGWNWSFRNITPGNNTQIGFSILEDPISQFSVGNFSIQLNTSNACGFTLSTQNAWVNITDIEPACDSSYPVTAAFTCTPSSGYVPLTTTCTQTGDYHWCEDVAFNWTWGEAVANTTTENPSHIYTADGTYTVQLTVTNATAEVNTTTSITVSYHTSPFIPRPTYSGSFSPLDETAYDALEDALGGSNSSSNTTNTSLGMGIDIMALARVALQPFQLQLGQFALLIVFGFIMIALWVGQDSTWIPTVVGCSFGGFLFYYLPQEYWFISVGFIGVTISVTLWTVMQEPR